MKKLSSKIFLLAVIAGSMTLASCTPNLLDQKDPMKVSYSDFWKTTDDAEYALHGAYYNVRGAFDRDYVFDGWGEYFRVRSNNFSTSSDASKLLEGYAYRGGEYSPQGSKGEMSNMFKVLYGGVNRANYVIENVEKMVAEETDASIKASLEAVVGESKVLRALCYFRLITLWGDVPYFTKVYDNSKFAPELKRSSVESIKDSILLDLTDATLLLPDKSPAEGRMGKAAAFGLRGKVYLYFASWTRTSWPWETPVSDEYSITSFTGGWPEANLAPDDAKSQAAYEAAAADFREIITNEGKYGVGLFRDGAPGQWGELGEADVLPNYFYQFVPQATDGGPAGNDSPETLIGFTHGGVGTGQGESYMRDFAGRSQESSQMWMAPRSNIIDRYQMTATGDFGTPVLRVKDSTRVNAATNVKTYLGRDYRMKSTILWNWEKIIGLTGKAYMDLPDHMVIHIYGNSDAPIQYRINGVPQWQDQAKTIPLMGRTYRYDSGNTGIQFRKFIRNYDGAGRAEGDFYWPTLRLADVYLMYAEAANFRWGPQGDPNAPTLAVECVNKVRGKGNLPALAASKYADQLTFFEAIEQERIIELFAEGHRGFDLRRWRRLETVFEDANGQIGPLCAGIKTYDTEGANAGDLMNNQSVRNWQRYYILKYPQAERERAESVGNFIPQNEVWY